VVRQIPDHRIHGLHGCTSSKITETVDRQSVSRAASSLGCTENSGLAAACRTADDPTPSEVPDRGSMRGTGDLSD
jgi:hypothetical protein